MTYYDKNGFPLLGGGRVKTPSGKKGYIYHTIDGDVRVTIHPETGLLGWFKPNELEVMDKKRRRRK